MILYVFIVIFIISPFLPATENPHWFFRTADFVRLQSILIELILLVLLVVLHSPFSTFDWIVFVLLIPTIIYQSIKVFPYSSFYPRKRLHDKSDCSVTILAGNVLQTNSSFGKFKALIKKYNPDLVLTMESNKDWEKGLSEIEKKYPFSIKIPKENFYGMHLYSKKELQNIEINYLIEEDVPSIFFEYPTPKKKSIFFACLHPAPPSPTENETSKERDAELMLVGKHIRSINKPTIVCGDMNDVVWSRTTRLFKKMTGMIDPRIGRGFFPTYHAKYHFMRFPLDHLFHTKDLYVGTMKRTAYFDSDHFAMYYEIHHRKNKDVPSNPKLNGDDKHAINEIISNVL